jgi:hypothetical protein
MLAVWPRVSFKVNRYFFKHFSIHYREYCWPVNDQYHFLYSLPRMVVLPPSILGWFETQRCDERINGHGTLRLGVNVSGGYEVLNIYICTAFQLLPFSSLFILDFTYVFGLLRWSFSLSFKVTWNLIKDAKWVEMARWKLYTLIVITSRWAWMIKLWRTLTRTVAPITWEVPNWLAL